jgi:hypothetical protein
MVNSIVARNDGTTADVNLGSQRLITYSLIGDNTGSGLSEAPVGVPDANGNLIGDPDGMGIIDPLLSPLRNFGGSTRTHALLPGSPAINAGDPDFVAPPDHDQRGLPFVRVSDGRIDMGALESQIAPVDFKHDNKLDCFDVDALVAAIVAGENPPEFDLTADDVVDQADLDVWLSVAGLENLPSGQAYLPGDASLDGAVDAMDLNLIGIHWLQNVIGWCSADFNADGQVDAKDLNILALNWRKDVSGVANARVPRAPLANRVVAAPAAAPQDSDVLIVASEPRFSPGDMNVELGTEYVSSSQVAERYVRRELRSPFTRVESRAHDFYKTQEIGQERLVDFVMQQW